MKLILVLFLTLSSFCIQASVLHIASGEYAPYSGEHIPDQGLSTRIIRAVFKEINQEIKIEFMPWKRVLNQTKNGMIAGSYPWNKNAERMEFNYYSNPIQQFRIFTFTKKGIDYKTEKDLEGKQACLPIGWDNTMYVDMINRNHMKVLNPVSTDSCFNMLALGRVDVIFMNELVGLEVMKRLFGDSGKVVGSEKLFSAKKVKLHFIVSKKYPNAQKIISDFNRGLEKIKANGVYDSLVSTKSSCVTCNRLGSM